MCGKTDQRKFAIGPTGKWAVTVSVAKQSKIDLPNSNF